MCGDRRRLIRAFIIISPGSSCSRLLFVTGTGSTLLVAIAKSVAVVIVAAAPTKSPDSLTALSAAAIALFFSNCRATSAACELGY